MSPSKSQISTPCRNLIAQKIYEKRAEIETWFIEQFKKTPAPLMSSVDIRDSGYKIVPVDCNLYPAGFNNICEVDIEHAPGIVRGEIEKFSKSKNISIPKRIAIYPESHTSNANYIENIYVLMSVLKAADFDVELAWPSLGQDPIALQSATGHTLHAHPIQSLSPVRLSSGFEPDWFLVNNDFSQGIPEFIKDISIPMHPTPDLGWFTRRKSTHFTYYNEIAAEFARQFDLDPWTITVESVAVDQINFDLGVGLDRIKDNAARVLENQKNALKQRSISSEPTVFIKNDSGTYGMGIHVIHDASELDQLNRRVKNKMSMGKGKTIIENVIIQEGVPTRYLENGGASEPVIYLFGEDFLGGFLRTNPNRGELENLNSQGMIFKKLCFYDLRSCQLPCEFSDFPVLEAAYGTIAKLSALAAGKEAYEKQHH